MPDIDLGRWVKDGNSLKAEAEKRGYRAAVHFADNVQATQNQQIRGFLAFGAKLLVVTPIDESVTQVIVEAAEAKVPVIAYDRLIIGSGDYDYFITFNNFKVGEQQGRSLVSALGLDAATSDSPKYITLFAGAPTDGNAFFFFDGAMGVLNFYIDKGVLKVVGPYPRTSEDRENYMKIATEGWSASAAEARMAELLSNQAKDVTLDGVLVPNDNLARAVIRACKADAKYKSKLPAIVGQDADFESLMLVKSGDQYSTIFKNTAKLSEAAIILADQILNGALPNIPGAILAGGNLEKMGDTGKKVVHTYLLEPVLITKANMDIPIDAGFYTSAESEELRK
jgi:putative multiple sugar transport system substrate-binding protein